MRRAQYDALDAVNWSALKVFGKSPAHYKALINRRGEPNDTDAKLFGRVCHTAVFEPDRIELDYALWEGRRAGREWEAFEVEAKRADKEVVLSDAMWRATELGLAVRSNELCAPLLIGGRAEFSVLWQTEVDGFGNLECKSRLDFWSEETGIADLKTCRDASPKAFARAIAEYEYHAQAAFYVDAIRFKTGRDAPFHFIAVESAVPHVAQAYRVPDWMLDLGRKRYQELLVRLCECRRDDVWPGYSTEVLDADMPTWALPLDFDDDVTDAGLVFTS